MTLKVVALNAEKEINIPFEHPLKSGHDAHMTMVKMSKAAKESGCALEFCDKLRSKRVRTTNTSARTGCQVIELHAILIG